MRGELSLYFHWPFCEKKCPYCPFFTLPNREESKEGFLHALLSEWEVRLPLFRKERVVSIYFGGGTPTLFLEGISTAMEKVGELLLSSDCEITVEANPEEMTLPLLVDLRSLGVNRVSLGVQSLDDSLLEAIGRRHSAQKGMEAVFLAKEAGFENVSIDLIYALPKQTKSSWESTLDWVECLPITHLSLYDLAIEPGTPFYRRGVQPPAEEEVVQMLAMACDRFAKMGLRRYEISAFAKDGALSRHNTGYWTGRPFLGFGPSASSYWGGRRFRNVADLEAYRYALARGDLPVDFEERLPFPANLHESLAIGLRMCEGVKLQELERRFSPLPDASYALLEELGDEGFLNLEGGRATLTEKGLLFYDSVAERIVIPVSEPFVGAKGRGRGEKGHRHATA